MQPEIAHQSEIHRRHLRLKIPIQAEIDGVRYQIDDWSAVGCAVKSATISRQPGERFPITLTFPFEEFGMTMRFDARLVYRDQSHGRFGCAFLGLSQAQTQVFRYLIDAYLSGEVVSAGDLLRLRARDEPAAGPAQPADGPADETELWRARLQRYAAWIGFGLAGLGLLIVVAWGIENRYLRGLSTSAVVEAPVIQLRAPIGGRLTTTVAAGARVPPGTKLGSLAGFDGTLVALESPCDCAVLEQPGIDGQPYPVGAPLFALVRADQPLLIRARLPLPATERLQIGDRVEIRVPGQSELRYGQIERIDLRVPLETLAKADGEIPSVGRRAQVLVRPDRPFGLEDFGTLVTVHFP